MIPIDNLLKNAEIHRKQTGLPLVTLSYAQSLDGSIAAVKGKPLSISGSIAQIITHGLRAAHDGILVGIGTILADDPQLTVRLVQGRNPQPCILDSTLRFPADAELLKRDEKLPWIATTEKASIKRQKALEKAGARIIRFASDDKGYVPIRSFLKYLAGEGMNSLMVEGGACVIGSFLSSQLVDQVVITIASCFVGGLPALDFSEEYISTETDFPRLSNMNVEMAGEDLIIWGKVEYPGEKQAKCK